METALINSLAWTLILGIWIFVGFGLRRSLRDLTQLFGRASGVAPWRRVASGRVAYA